MHIIYVYKYLCFFHFFSPKVLVLSGVEIIIQSHIGETDYFLCNIMLYIGSIILNLKLSIYIRKRCKENERPKKKMKYEYVHMHINIYKPLKKYIYKVSK